MDRSQGTKRNPSINDRSNPLTHKGIDPGRVRAENHLDEEERNFQSNPGEANADEERRSRERKTHRSINKS
jgi:hypothetical protein